MPRGDGTGPAGMGSRTGRSAGFCAGFPIPGFRNAGYGRGIGFGRYRGHGRIVWLAGLFFGCGYLAYRWANRKAHK